MPPPVTPTPLPQRRRHSYRIPNSPYGEMYELTLAGARSQDLYSGAINGPDNAALSLSHGGYNRRTYIMLPEDLIAMAREMHDFAVEMLNIRAEAERPRRTRRSTNTDAS